MGELYCTHEREKLRLVDEKYNDFNGQDVSKSMILFADCKCGERVKLKYSLERVEP